MQVSFAAISASTSASRQTRGKLSQQTAIPVVVAKSEKCILVGYSDEQKVYKCYNPRTKQACVSRDVVFNESASWYQPSAPQPEADPSFDEEVSEAEMPRDEPEIGT
jgi:hypothetical protein